MTTQRLNCCIFRNGCCYQSMQNVIYAESSNLESNIASVNLALTLRSEEVNLHKAMIYLDHNATTPTLPEVVDAMLPWLRNNWSNPSSIYSTGRTARRAVEKARSQLAALVDCDPEQVVFTSGATEANNAALHSSVFRDPSKRHIVTSVVEHSAVLAYCDYLERIHGIEVTRLSVDSNGGLNAEELRAAIRSDTAIVSLMWANNETGVIWPVREYAEVCAETETPFHSDAVQAAGKIRVSFSSTGLDYLSLSGHKFGATKGTGALIIREPDGFLPLLHGGKQEHKLRGGTENVAQIIGLGKAAELSADLRSNNWEKIGPLRDLMESKILEVFPESRVNGGQSFRLPNTSNLLLPNLDGDALVTFLDQKSICISSGSACLESAITPSHVILAMHDSYDNASESVRISLGPKTTEDDVGRLISGIKEFASNFG